MNLYIIILSLFIVMITLTTSCDETQRDKASQPELDLTNKSPDTRFIPGQILNSLSCKANPQHTYSLYIPSFYADSLQWPVIYIFDPQARSRLPLERYQRLAEEFGYILVASGFSKNGVPWNEVVEHLNILGTEVKSNLSTDPSRVYMMGFSGGARVAAGAAMGFDGIEGVIGCGAGFPLSGEANQRKFNYIGIIGNEDFNLSEMLQLDEELEDKKYRHHLVIFEGNHDWPPEEKMRDAFKWVELCAIENKLAVKNEGIIKIWLSEEMATGAALNDTADVNSLFLHYKKVINFYEKIADVSEFRELIKPVERSPELSSLREELTMVLIEEDQLKNHYSNAFSTQKETWWIAEFSRMNKVIKEAPQSIIAKSNKRLKSYIGLIAYMYSTRAIKSAALAEAMSALKIYALAEPSNPEHAYLSAIVYMKRNEQDKAIESLQRAFALGFTDTERLLNDPELLPLQRNEKFRELLKT